MVKRKTKRKKRIISSQDTGSYIDTDTVLLRNRAVENAVLDNFMIRFPHLLLHSHFYYKFIEGGACTIGNHAHLHWEISRVCSGCAEYSVEASSHSFQPLPTQYVVLPPKVTHGWTMQASPLLTHSWQVQITAEDATGEQILNEFKEYIVASGFLVEASSSQKQVESVLWQMAGKNYPAQIFGPILSGFSQIVLGELIAKVNPWPAGFMDAGNNSQAALSNLAQRMKVFLDDNLSNSVTLDDMESHFHYSGRHLNRIFQEIYHCSIGHYLRVQRIELSKRWLATTDRSIKDIALSLGYSNSSQFCRYFLSQAGQTPSGYRQTILSANTERVQQSVREDTAT